MAALPIRAVVWMAPMTKAKPRVSLTDASQEEAGQPRRAIADWTTEFARQNIGHLVIVERFAASEIVGLVLMARLSQGDGRHLGEIADVHS
ncbi:hypothetical protein D3C86_636240 [compost metagenome]